MKQNKSFPIKGWAFIKLIASSLNLISNGAIFILVKHWTSVLFTIQWDFVKSHKIRSSLNYELEISFGY